MLVVIRGEMKLSTKSRYSVRLMVELAMREAGHPVFLKDAAQKQNLSEKYMSRLVIPLRGAGLIISARGHTAGTCLPVPLKRLPSRK